MSEKSSEANAMDSTLLMQQTLRTRIAPPTIGSVKARRRHVTRQLGWSPSRVKDIWYADPRISISADEIRQVQDITGIFDDAKRELRRNEELIDAAAAILGDAPEGVLSIILAALVKLGRS